MNKLTNNTQTLSNVNSNTDALDNKQNKLADSKAAKQADKFPQNHTSYSTNDYEVNPNYVLGYN